METIVAGLFIGFVAWVFLTSRQKAHRDRQLARTGLVVNGRITRRYERRIPKARRLTFIEYQFDTPSGETFARQMRVAREQYGSAQVGDEIAVIYDPAAPSLSRPRAYLVGKGYLD